MRTKRRLRWNPVVFLRNMLVLAAIFILLAGVAVPGEKPDNPPQEVVVRRGDTLWALASKLRPGQDPRELVYELTRVNGLQSRVLTPGMVLVIP